LLKIAWSEIYDHPLPTGHRFPMEKYSVFPGQLIHEGIVEPENFFSPQPISKADAVRVHDPAYFDRLVQLELTKREQRVSGFPHNEVLIHRELVITQGTIDAAYLDVENILIVDLDVHQGNGTAAIFENNPNVFTFSMHGKNNYPLQKMNSDLDIGLEDGTGDEEYLETLSKTLDHLFKMLNPDIVFYLSGVDVIKEDKLGRLGLSMQGCKSRDEMVINTCKELELPLVVTMGGGYAADVKLIIEAHTNTYRTVKDVYF